MTFAFGHLSLGLGHQPWQPSAPRVEMKFGARQKSHECHYASLVADRSSVVTLLDTAAIVAFSSSRAGQTWELVQNSGVYDKMSGLKESLGFFQNNYIYS
jgi:hypothetical protein